MNRRTAAWAAIATCAALLLPGCATGVSKNAADNTLGVWKRNMVESRYPTDPLTGMIMTREPIPGGIRIIGKGQRKDGGAVDYTLEVIYDGKDHPVVGVGAPYDTLAITPIDANHQRSATKKGKYSMVGLTEVSADGKRMTVTNTGTNANGEPMDFMVIWDKQ
ncbi:MAG TPA: hypothetical protein VG735_12685 [Caulobacterales bacterium]|nr:hypothetical protein [Caulobacterales bacterium]